MKCIIIGLGTYGRVLVDELSALGHEVIAADNDASRVERVKDMCDAAFQIEATDELALSVLPLKKVDIVIVAIGQNLGASVRVVALLKKLGVEHIYARAMDYVHKNILQAFSIDKILIPEERAARALVREMELGSVHWGIAQRAASLRAVSAEGYSHQEGKEGTELHRHRI